MHQQNCRNDSYFLAKTVLVFAINSAKRRPEFLAKAFFWSVGMVAARLNLIRTGCGPLVQKIADPCPKPSQIIIGIQEQTILSCYYKNVAGAILYVTSEKTMHVIMKCNTVLPEKAY